MEHPKQVVGCLQQEEKRNAGFEIRAGLTGLAFPAKWKPDEFEEWLERGKSADVWEVQKLKQKSGQTEAVQLGH